MQRAKEGETKVKRFCLKMPTMSFRRFVLIQDLPTGQVSDPEAGLPGRTGMKNSWNVPLRADGLQLWGGLFTSLHAETEKIKCTTRVL